MREQEEIEQEMFEARQDLEENLGQFVHRAREKVQVKERAKHSLDEFYRAHTLQILLGIVGGMVLLGLLRRPRSATSWDRSR
jgi:hypothetical protein